MCVPIALLVLIGQFAAASDYAVTATVPAPLPTDPPTILTPTNGAVVSTANVTVSGTCPVVSPAVIIAVYDGGVLVGSVSCSTAGDFSLPVSLDYGAHTLVATVSTITGQTGASSGPVVVTRPLPAASSPSPTPSSTPTRESSLPAVPGISNLPPFIRITTNDQYVLLDGNNRGTWHGAFSGGMMPYSVAIDWGDRTIDHFSVHDQTEQSYSHHYETADVYPIIITVTDQDGNTTTLYSTAVTFMLRQKSVVDIGLQIDQMPPIVAFIQKNLIQIYIVTLSGLTFLWYLEHGRQFVWNFMMVGARRKTQRPHGRHRA